MTLSGILKKIGVDCRLIGSDEFYSLGLASYNSGEKVCTFVESEKYIDGLSDNISVVLTNENTASAIEKSGRDIGICVVDNPRSTFFRIHQSLSDDREYAREALSTKIGKNCNISSLAYVSPKNVVIGDNVTIEEFCSIKPNTVIGNNSVVRAGTVIGGEGFEVKTSENGNAFVVKHLGGVIIGDNVEIQSNCCICKALYPWDDTIVSDNVKIDNLVHVAHGVKIGEFTKIVTHAAIGGRTVIGKYAWIGIGAVIRNGIVIGNNTRVNMGAVVTKDVPDGMYVSGNFAIEHSKYLEHLKEIR
ncbi:MAG: UDP-3-O-(3-hydroxymyristoyl)glucosamine N-acyltransferase [Firmicutes bacterium]|nr:UDP-3-O-(3-hydroxymyristoyl)glucosamine N-acyltransferase [Bacillota bacterium]